jgi:hypothetical protein
VNIEFSLSDARAKARALATLLEHGYDADTGAVRLAYPFAVLVREVAPGDVDAVRRLVTAVDPAAGTIVPAAVTV